MNDYICRFIDLPSKVNAITVVDENGDYNIYINEKLSDENKKKAFHHECKHIKNNHFFIKKSVYECEKEAEQT